MLWFERSFQPCPSIKAQTKIFPLGYSYKILIQEYQFIVPLGRKFYPEIFSRSLKDYFHLHYPYQWLSIWFRFLSTYWAQFEVHHNLFGWIRIFWQHSILHSFTSKHNDVVNGGVILWFTMCLCLTVTFQIRTRRIMCLLLPIRK